MTTINVNNEEEPSEEQPEETENIDPEATDEDSRENQHAIESVATNIEALRAEGEVERWSQLIQYLNQISNQNQTIIERLESLSNSQLATVAAIAESEAPTSQEEAIPEVELNQPEPEENEGDEAEPKSNRQSEMEPTRRHLYRRHRG